MMDAKLAEKLTNLRKIGEMFALGISEVELFADDLIQPPPPPPTYPLKVPGIFLSTGVPGNIELTLKRAIETENVVGLHLERPWRLIEPTVRKRDFAVELHCGEALAKAGKYLFYTPTFKTFGSDKGVCPADFKPFQHKQNETAWMPPFHTNPAAVDAYCDFLLVAKVRLDDPVLAYVETPETAPGNLFPKTLYGPLESAWLAIIDTLAAFRYAQPLVCLNSFPTSALRERMVLRNLGQSVPDAMSRSFTENVLQPFVCGCSLAAVQEHGTLAKAMEWARTEPHFATAVTVEDWMDWTQTKAALEALPWGEAWLAK